MRKSNIIDSSKIDKLLNKELDHLTNPIILEFGIQLGSSTKFLLDICEKKMAVYTL